MEHTTNIQRAEVRKSENKKRHIPRRQFVTTTFCVITDTHVADFKGRILVGRSTEKSYSPSFHG